MKSDDFIRDSGREVKLTIEWEDTEVRDKHIKAGLSLLWRVEEERMGRGKDGRAEDCGDQKARWRMREDRVALGLEFLGLQS